MLIFVELLEAVLKFILLNLIYRFSNECRYIFQEAKRRQDIWTSALFQFYLGFLLIKHVFPLIQK